LRIIGGTRKGRHLVDWEDTAIRPVRDFVRTALFNIIEDFLSDAVCLDLYCGVGSLGLESLSRGARRCVFVDSSADACRIVRRNLDALDLLAGSEVFEGDVLQTLEHLKGRGRRFDVVFIDPPYFTGLAASTVEALGEGRLLGTDALVVVATHQSEALVERTGRLVRVDQRRYGDNALAFFRPDADGGSLPGEDIG
jgi:16S rRNA (guanine966-N2)-methyltransferase